ncbi:MAG: patatin-like phospholipase family protein [Clostridia bacterium]|nr:patatin-like phospholipase family protein [Clostridia bacterium]
MKRALVLSGGGSRGAYECGAWQALREMNIRIDGVYGASIGAINAALVAQGDLDTAVKLWNSITMRQIVELDEEEDFNIDRMLARKRDLIPFLLENAKNLRMDISPLEKLVAENIDEGRVRASGMDFGVMLTRFPQLSGYEVRLDDIPQGQLGDYLIASASCFPVFPIKNIGGERYIDGGFADNMPVGMAIEDGAEEIIGIDIHPQPVHPEYRCMPFMKLIHPLHELGGFLDFTPALLRRSRMMGYYDTMKAYGRFDGIRYTFTRVNELRISETARRYVQKIARFDAGMDGRGDDAVLIGAIGQETPSRMLSWKETLLRGLELAAQALGFREDAIYDFDALNQRMLGFVRGRAVLDEVPSEKTIHEAAKGGSRNLAAYLYAAIRMDGDFLFRCARKLSDYPMELAAAVYLDTVG